MEIKDKIQKAKAQLLMEQPFYASLMLRLNYVQTTSVETCSTDGISIEYNPKYFANLSNDELKGVLAHLVLHTAMLHHTRRGSRDLIRWNKAADYAINPLLLAAKFILPSNALYAEEYVNQSAEHIYSQLAIQEQPETDTSEDESLQDDDPQYANSDQPGPGENEDSEDNDEKNDADNDSDPNETDNDTSTQSDDNKNADDKLNESKESEAPSQGDKNSQGKQNLDESSSPINPDAQESDQEQNSIPENNPSNIGDFKDPPKNVDLQAAEADIKQAIVQAMMIAKRQGKLPGDIERAIQEILEPKIDWREALSRFISEVSKDDYTWLKPATRFLHARIYLPALQSDTIGKLILIADTSISITNQILNQFAGEVQEITTTFNIPLQVLFVDTKVAALQDIEPDEPIHLQAKGGGGTDFKPGFEYIEQNDLTPKAVIYLTDGECRSFPETPDYPVLWAQFGYAEFNPPFGEVIQVNQF